MLFFKDKGQTWLVPASFLCFHYKLNSLYVGISPHGIMFFIAFILKSQVKGTVHSSVKIQLLSTRPHTDGKSNEKSESPQNISGASL